MPVWTAAKNLALTGIRSLDRPARREPLYRLRYSGLHMFTVFYNIYNEMQISYNANYMHGLCQSRPYTAYHAVPCLVFAIKAAKVN